MKRRLILRDSLTFLGLSLATVVLFVITLFLFRSFTDHRAELAKRWSDRGVAALHAGRPDLAIVALRTALTYAPGERSYELLLAQALGDAAQTEEAYNYFAGLWESEPGNGFINLQLARLATKKNDKQDAIHFYRASTYGTWEGDGVVRRREVRLELARYLIAQRDFATARTELLTAAGNSPDSPDFDRTLGDLFQQAEDPDDALTYYQKAIAARPDDRKALEEAGKIEYRLGNFTKAHGLLERALREQSSAPYGTPNNSVEITALLQNCERILDLFPSPKLPAGQRVDRILTARTIAKERFDTCATKLGSPDQKPSDMEALGARWASAKVDSSKADLLRDAEKQDADVQLIYDTEIQTSQICGSPSGDDALLLLLAKSPAAVER